MISNDGKRQRTRHLDIHCRMTVVSDLPESSRSRMLRGYLDRVECRPGESDAGGVAPAQGIAELPVFPRRPLRYSSYKSEF